MAKKDLEKDSRLEHRVEEAAKRLPRFDADLSQ